MKNFKEFIEKLDSKKTDEGHIIVPTPIHFKQTIDDKKLKENLDDDNQHHYSNDSKSNFSQMEYHNLSQKLHDATASTIPTEDRRHINKYTDDSRDLNHHLIEHRTPHPDHDCTHNAIMKHAKPTGYEFHLMSGTSHDFGHIAKHSKDGILHSPAHISATHKQKIAESFAYSSNSSVYKNKGILHAIKIHVGPHDKVLHVSRLPNSMKGEHETIIPAGTKLEYSHSTHEKPTEPMQGIDHIKIDHFTIHSQE